MSIDYKKMRESSADKSYELGVICFDWIYEKMAWKKPVINWHLNQYSQYCYQANCNNELLGFSLGFIDGDMGYISWLAVHPNYRRMGIGKNLLLKTTSALKIDTNFISSHVRLDGSAELFFEKCGFKDINQKKMEMIL